MARGEERLGRERLRLLLRLQAWLEAPMVALAFAWLALTALELAGRQTPALGRLQQGIWIIFILEFGLRLALAPRRGRFLQANWLTALALALPALRLVRVARLFRAARGLRLARLLTTLNRGMRALGRTLERRGFGYALALTLLVTLLGAAGMLAFEREAGLPTYGEALWWTAMLMTTIGSEYWPRTAEGRVLAVLLSVYALSVFGYITAALASFFVGRDASPQQTELKALREEIAGLRAALERRPD